MAAPNPSIAEPGLFRVRLAFRLGAGLKPAP